VQRASISRTTLGKIEKGDPGVAMGHYSTILFAMGMADRLGDLADPRSDNVGLQREEERLPQRIRIRRTKGKLSNGMRNRSFTVILPESLTVRDGCWDS
jgi:hypothetical protein